MVALRRRDFLRLGITTVGAATFGHTFWRDAYGAPARPGRSPYGPLRAADENGLLLPEGFTSRVVARSAQPVPATTHVWHLYPDGAATYPAEGGGWVYASNSEVRVASAGGAGALRFDPDGGVTDAYPILVGTSVNCAGGPTPWGTWLSCEEWEGGQVWECDPFERSQGVARPALGTFSHEAVAVDPDERRLYLTEDVPDGAFYRFTPTAYPDLGEGLLELAVVEGLEGETADRAGSVRWVEVPEPSPTHVPVYPFAPSNPTRRQVPDATRFSGGEGVWFDSGVVYFTTKGDNRVWSYEPRKAQLGILYDAARLEDPPLTGVDNILVASSGDIFVAEDGGDMELMLITPQRVVAPFLQIEGQNASEIAGPAFSPDGTRLYFSSMRASNWGITYEVAGPFRESTTGRPRPTPSETLSAVGSPSPTPTATPSGTGVPSPAGSPTTRSSPGTAGAPEGPLPTTGAGAAAVGAAALAAAAVRRRSGRRS